MEEGVEREDSERQVMVTDDGDNEGGDETTMIAMGIYSIWF